MTARERESFKSLRKNIVANESRIREIFVSANMNGLEGVRARIEGREASIEFTIDREEVLVEIDREAQGNYALLASLEGEIFSFIGNEIDLVLQRALKPFSEAAFTALRDAAISIAFQFYGDTVEDKNASARVAFFVPAFPEEDTCTVDLPLDYIHKEDLADNPMALMGDERIRLSGDYAQVLMILMQ